MKCDKTNTKIKRKDLETHIAIWQHNFMSVESNNLKNSNTVRFYFRCIFCIYSYSLFYWKIICSWRTVVRVCVCVWLCVQREKGCSFILGSLRSIALWLLLCQSYLVSFLPPAFAFQYFWTFFSSVDHSLLYFRISSISFSLLESPSLLPTKLLI